MTAQTLKRAARAQAAAWIVRLHGPHRSPELENAFRDWLAAHPENAKQFERVTEVWDAGSGLKLSARLPARRQILAAALLLAGGLAGWYVWEVPAYTTGVGEQRIVRLDDGTRLSLNSGTRVRIRYSASQRRVELERGEAYFEVARNPARPFIVSAGDQQVIALGTVFVVRYDAARTAVTLLEGKVAVGPGSATVANIDDGASSAGIRRLVLSPGERLTLTRGAGPKIDEPKIEAVTAWRRGEVVLDKTLLADAIAELNRYDRTRLVIEDPQIAALPISGIYQAGDSRGFARAVAKLYDLQVAEQSDRITLRPSR